MSELANVDGVTRLCEDHPSQTIDPVEWLNEHTRQGREISETSRTERPALPPHHAATRATVDE